MSKMTPREAFNKLISDVKAEAYLWFEQSPEYKTLEALVLATEQAPTLEKLGYKLDKVLHEKGGTIWEYVNNLDYCISISKENGDTEYHAFKTAFGEYLVFTESELRAIVREIEEEKMKGKEKTK